MDSSTSSHTKTSSSAERWFYPAASLLLLILTFIGFRMFYLDGRAFPGRPLTPPIRGTLIAHGVSMTAWMLLAVVQPILVASGFKRWHRTLGRIGAALAIAVVILGIRVSIEATRVNPPEMLMFGLTMKQFMAIPFLSILAFGAFVAAGVIYRKRPEVHRPMMLMSSLAVVSAATGRMPALNGMYAGTLLEVLFTSFLATMALGAIMFGGYCALKRRLDRGFAIAYSSILLISVGISLIARTSAWDALATFLLR
jgi:hypothetical protein